MNSPARRKPKKPVHAAAHSMTLLGTRGVVSHICLRIGRRGLVGVPDCLRSLDTYQHILKPRQRIGKWVAQPLLNLKAPDACHVGLYCPVPKGLRLGRPHTYRVPPPVMGMVTALQISRRMLHIVAVLNGRLSGWQAQCNCPGNTQQCFPGRRSPVQCSVEYQLLQLRGNDWRGLWILGEKQS